MTVLQKVPFVFLILLTLNCLLAADPPTFGEIRKKYEDLQKNDVRALPFVNKFIEKAKKESNFPQLVQGYRDAVLFNPLGFKKLMYSDSMVYAALLTRDNDLISIAYLGKGIVYYSNFKKYKPALDEYVKAFHYSKTTKDGYLKHKVLYHLGVVKNYLGYYDDAISHFKECVNFFEKKSESKLHPNEIYNYRKGYFNSLHQLTICYGNMMQYEKADSIVLVGLSQIDNTDNARDFTMERNYFVKSRGILNFYHHNNEGAIADLNQSLPAIIEADDFEWMSIIYFYLGRSYLNLDNDKAISNFQKVDSIFSKYNFMVPRIRSNYEYLINHYRKKKDFDKQLYYTNKLLKADSLISKDFTYLSLKIHKEYDRQTLLDQKKHLENSNYKRSSLAVIFFIFTFILLVVIYLSYRKKRNIEIKYKELQDQFIIKDRVEEISENTSISTIDYPKTLTDEITNDLIQKLLIFEKNNQFIQQGLTENILAAKLKTNTTYLSKVINQTKGMNFNRYIADLRIKYITKLLYTQKKYLHYTIESLATECGMASRQSFSDQFFEINGIRPKDFIRRRKEEIEGNKNELN